MSRIRSVRSGFRLITLLTLILQAIFIGAGVFLSCNSAPAVQRGSEEKRFSDTLRKEKWKASQVTVSAYPAGVQILVYDPVARAYKVAGFAPGVVKWFHHCTACDNPEPVAPVVLEYGGTRISVIPAGDRKGKTYAVDADFRGGEPVIRKGIPYNPEIAGRPEVHSSFPGGEEALDDFVMHALYYPAPARVKGIEGKVYASFVVEQDGSPSNLQILRGIGGGCDEEVLDIIHRMPRWIPASVGGKPVRTGRIIVVSFFLGNQNHVKSVYYLK